MHARATTTVAAVAVFCAAAFASRFLKLYAQFAHEFSDAQDVLNSDTCDAPQYHAIQNVCHELAIQTQTWPSVRAFWATAESALFCEGGVCLQSALASALELLFWPTVLLVTIGVLCFVGAVVNQLNPFGGRRKRAS